MYKNKIYKFYILTTVLKAEAVAQSCFMKKVFLKNFDKKYS